MDKTSITEGLRKLQQPDGSFVASVEAAENDMRFVYLASSICYILNDFSGIDVDATVNFVLKSIRYDGGIAQGPGLEAHGGSTFCGLASLKLLGRLDALSTAQRSNLLRWCVSRLHQGFQGRPNKPDDTCYTFWLGAAIRILCRDESEVRRFGRLCSRSHKYVLNTQEPIVGGFGKWPSVTPDPLHTYLGLCGMALFGDHPDLLPTVAALNMTERAQKSLLELHTNR